MTREQDLERQLAEWLADGPTGAPTEVVQQALQQTAGRRQWRGVWRMLLLLAHRDRRDSVQRVARLTALGAVLAGILLATVVISVPFFGGAGASPSPSPSASPIVTEAPQAVVGVAVVETTSATPTEALRTIDLESDDPRISGRASQRLTVLLQAGGAQQLQGTMNLKTASGDWEGQVDIVRYRSGEEYEYASLRGSGTHKGYTYVYAVHQAAAEAERTVEGAIWPDEPSSLPDPSLLP